MSHPVDTFRSHFRFALVASGRARDTIHVVYTAPPAEQEVTAASAALDRTPRDALLQDVRVEPAFLKRFGEGGDQLGDLKSLRRIYGRSFPLPYAAAMAGALGRAHNRGCAQLRGYLSRDEERILPRLFPLQHVRHREYRARTSALLRAAGDRMPVFYELIGLACEQLD
ncbi:hypothetical protein [Halorhodospira halophila]|uniref:Uncharacterized protein n=1 Tax=Halorhodospira halophila (strain DSM 244 / SL1) TaxID=349124 RepID=A1WTC1_HALHL|nr:hypothetical protein [Halorhodospira halophila]ABM60933.1 hypothetical protein Hhal_0139 [Halorhodospira halophila SL1]MBK1728591.1 hypothetical protein [Halorhodospira halophila]